MLADKNFRMSPETVSGKKLNELGLNTANTYRVFKNDAGQILLDPVTPTETFQNQLKNYADWEKSSKSILALQLLEKRRQRIAQMTETEMKDAEFFFERFKESIDSDRPEDAKLYL
ncbi:hypothetical protein APA_700 [Pseudanabaena sp. lw0831]|uniref:hypothetical protein n=1 Tax=Pseudanabaena sp. lw0831 TaxID=1357935 RepID=UPI001915650C|nr:hypothetical protein [Pseudanabaena sp. lw0831]GBO52899.1 hypothetical protein APA_700 [Pseudanabaena sp. lw0831]